MCLTCTPLDAYAVFHSIQLNEVFARGGWVWGALGGGGWYGCESGRLKLLRLSSKLFEVSELEVEKV